MLSQCYFPDGTPVNGSSNPPMVPCNPSAASSACCSTGDACSADGLCVSSDFFFYRGACTDKDWIANACPSYCRTSAQTSTLGGFDVISLCQDVFDTPGNTKTFTCNADVSNCAVTNFTRDGVNNPILFGNITGQSTTPTTSGSSTSSVVSSTTTVTVTASADGSTVITKTSSGVIAAAVAVPVVLAVALFLVLWWGMKEYRRRIQAERLVSDWSQGDTNSNAVLMPLQEHFAPERKAVPVQAQEIATDHAQEVDAYPTQRVELEGRM